MATGTEARSHWQRLELIQKSDLSAQQKMLLVWLWKYTGQNDSAWPKQDDLCRDMTLSARQLRRLQDSLKGILTVTRTGGANLYTVEWEALGDRTSTSGLGEQHDTNRPDIYVRSDRTSTSGLGGGRPDIYVRSDRTSTSGLTSYKESKNIQYKNPPTPLADSEADSDPEAPEGVHHPQWQTPGMDDRRACVAQPDIEILFLAGWEAAEGRKRYERSVLTEIRRRELMARSLHPDWDWQAALAKFPLKAARDGPDGWLPTVEWFLREGTVEAILEGKYDFRPGGKRGGGAGGKPSEGAGPAVRTGWGRRRSQSSA